MAIFKKRLDISDLAEMYIMPLEISMNSVKVSYKTECWQHMYCNYHFY